MSDMMTEQAPQGGSDRPFRRPRWLVPADRRDALTGIALVTPAVASAPAAEALAEDVADGALAGKYGPDVEQRAEWLREDAERRGLDHATISRAG